MKLSHQDHGNLQSSLPGRSLNVCLIPPGFQDVVTNDDIVLRLQVFRIHVSHVVSMAFDVKSHAAFLTAVWVVLDFVKLTQKLGPFLCDVL